jgi:hypothetical protein
MTIQERNSDLVEILRPDFFGRSEPNASLVHAGLHMQLPMLRAYYPFSSVDENGAVYDLSGQGRMLTNNGATPFANYNLFPYANLTPGAANYFYRADEPGLDITGALTLGGWFWLDSLAPGTNYGLISKWDSAGGANQRSYMLYFDDATNTLKFNISSAGTAATSVAVTSTATMAASTWYHIVGRFNPATLMSIFVDGTATDLAVGVPAAAFNSTAQLRIGDYNSGQYMDGRVCQCWLCADDLDSVLIKTAFEQTRVNFGK